MKLRSSIILIHFVFFGLTGSSSAQKSIIISDSLAAHADVLEVDAEYQSGRNRKFKLGAYSIYTDEAWSGTDRSSKEKLTSEGMVTNIRKYFSFTISSGVDSAEVYMEEKSKMKTYDLFAESENFNIGNITSTKLISHAAWITINGDTSTTWTLYVPVKEKNESYFEMLLSDGVRFINVSPVSSDPDFNYAHPMRSARRMPAMGAAFIDNGKFICAVQYTSGVTGSYAAEGSRSYGCKAWMHKDIDERTRLVLAAAMSTMLLISNPYLVIFGD